MSDDLVLLASLGVALLVDGRDERHLGSRDRQDDPGQEAVLVNTGDVCLPPELVPDLLPVTRS